MNISILTSQKKFTRGFNDFHPIYRWRKELKNEGFRFKFYNKHKKLREADILIIDYRYVRTLFGDWTEDAKTFTISLCKRNKGKYNKIIFFDTGDSAGSRCFGMLEHVDLFWKKQILSNLENYLINNGEKNWMYWLPEELNEYSRHYDIPNSKDLKKIKVAWNIGYSGIYKSSQLKRFLLLNTVWSKIFIKPDFSFAFKNGNIFSSYRVTFKQNNRYDYQRSLIQKELFQLKDKYTINCDGKLSYNEYLKEVENTKVMVSPFGWGEICFRDFEAILNGSLLVKPNMKHICTYPDVFLENKTYVPISWDASNLNNVLDVIYENQDNYSSMVKKAQKIYKNAIQYESFIKHLQSIL